MDPPWLVDVPAWYEEHILGGYVVVHQDDDRLYWTGDRSMRWSRRARDALVDEVAPWRPGGNPVPAEGRCVRVVIEGFQMVPIYKWPARRENITPAPVPPHSP